MAFLNPIEHFGGKTKFLEIKKRDNIKTEYCKKNNFQVRYIHQMELSMGQFSVVEGGEGGDCKICNRMRLTADGKIKPCLFNNLEYNIRELGIDEAIAKALKHKPKCGSVNTNGTFYNIGG